MNSNQLKKLFFISMFTCSSLFSMHRNGQWTIVPMFNVTELGGKSTLGGDSTEEIAKIAYKLLKRADQIHLIVSTIDFKDLIEKKDKNISDEDHEQKIQDSLIERTKKYMIEKNEKYKLNYIYLKNGSSAIINEVDKKNQEEKELMKSYENNGKNPLDAITSKHIEKMLNFDKTTIKRVIAVTNTISYVGDVF